MKIKLNYNTMAPKFILVLLLAFLLGSLVGKGAKVTAQDSVNNESFNTPEETITFYMQAVASAEVPEIMKAIAADEMSENFRFDLYVDRIRSLNPQSPGPSDYVFYEEINKAQFSWQLLFQTRNLAYGLLATEKGLVEGMTLFLEPEEFAMFANEVNPERLAQLEVVAIDVPYPEIVETERLQEIWNAQARIYGADELTERVALLLFDEEYYFVGFTLLRYGEDWKISIVSSALSGTSALGAPLQTTEEEYQDMVDGD